MECSICMDAITKQTGSVILSCEHNFHFRCIDEWFTKQLLDDLHQTCPCCRSEGTELDRCMYEEVREDEEDNDEESYEEDDDEVSEAGSLDEFAERIWDGTLRLERNASGQWVVIDTQDMAFESLRSVFGPLNDLDEEAPIPPAPVQQNSGEDLVRVPLYHWRRDVGVIVSPSDEEVDSIVQEAERRWFAAQKIQAIFRGNQVRNTHKAAVTLMRLFQQAYNL